MTPVPTMSDMGGFAAIRFIMMNGDQGGIHDMAVAMVPLGSLGINIMVPNGTIKISMIGPMKF